MMLFRVGGKGVHGDASQQRSVYCVSMEEGVCYVSL